MLYIYVVALLSYPLNAKVTTDCNISTIYYGAFETDANSLIFTYF
jgi:hypothetical protein